MPNYINTGPGWGAEAAEFGGAAGNSLAQALYQVPMQRAQMQMQLAQMMQERQRMQLQQQYNQNRLAETLRYHDLEKQYHDAMVEGQNTRGANSLEEEKRWHGIQAQNEELSNQVRDMLAQIALLKEHREGGRPVPLGNGNVWFPDMAGGQQPQARPQVPQRQGQMDPSTNMLMAPDAGFAQVQRPPQSNNGLPPGVMQLPAQPGKGLNGLETGNSVDANTTRALLASLPYYASSNALQRIMLNGGAPIWNAVTNRAMGRLPAQGGQSLQATNNPDPLGLFGQ